MKPIYVVMGSCGEYSDRTEWNVVAYEDEAKAKRHCLLAEQYGRIADEEVKVARNLWFADDKTEAEFPRPVNPYDPFYRTDYSGTRYWIDKVDVLDDLPKVES